MGRAPCCEKMGLKKGPWTPDEDHILVNYIRLHGHNNWRALPKQAGLLRCGKSCRLRWTNYLRPDIKRGNFTQDEEETIIKLHGLLGNRWSAIAARLPGRTDNEIKNVWHTHLKKRLPLKLEVTSSPVNSGSTPTATATTSTSSSVATATVAAAATAINVTAGPTRKRSRKANVSKRNVAPKKRVVPKHENSMEPSGNDERTSDTAIVVKVIKTEPCTSDVSTSDVSTVTSTSTTTTTTTTTTSTTTATTNSTSENDNDARLEDNAGGKQDDDDNVADVPEINDDFWMEVLSVEDTAMSTEDLPCITMSDDHILVTEPFVKMEYPSDNCEDMDVFWHNLLTKSHEILEITEMV